MNKNSPAYKVEILTDSTIDKWNDFIAKCDKATFFHRAEWRTVIEKAFGHKAIFLYAENNNNVTAVLPLVQVKSRLFGHALISTPFCVYGGPVYNSEEALNAILEKACDLARSMNVDYLELRTSEPVRPEWPVKDLYVSFNMQLVADRDAIMQKIWRKQRTVIRKSFKQGLTHSYDTSNEDFYRTFSTSVRNLGTPVFTKKYFDLLLATFQEECEILTVRKDGKAVSSVLSFYDQGCVYPYYGGGLPEARYLKSNDYMYYELMCHAAIDKGINNFDFGRSKKGTGAYEYKKHWQMEPEELQYQYYLVKSDSLPNLSPNNPKYRLMINLWKRLPLRVSQILGPQLSKFLG